MIHTTHTKKLEQFKKEYLGLLAKYPEVQLWSDLNGRIHASIGRDRTRLLSHAPKVAK
jgi:hypothetical protein